MFDPSVTGDNFLIGEVIADALDAFGWPSSQLGARVRTMNGANNDFLHKLEATSVTTLDHVQDKSFKNETVELDGKKFSNCSFDRCVFEYSGGDTEIGFRCSTTGIRPQFKGAAARTVRLLHALGLLSYDPFAKPEDWPDQNTVTDDRDRLNRSPA